MARCAGSVLLTLLVVNLCESAVLDSSRLNIQRIGKRSPPQIVFPGATNADRTPPPPPPPPRERERPDDGGDLLTVVRPATTRRTPVTPTLSRRPPIVIPTLVTSPRPPTPPPPPGNATPKSACESACLLTPEYNPLCGDDRNTYKNPATLLCAQNCGKQIRIAHYGACPRPPVEEEPEISTT